MPRIVRAIPCGKGLSTARDAVARIVPQLLVPINPV
jgi:hypothetical protein